MAKSVLLLLVIAFSCRQTPKNSPAGAETIPDSVLKTCDKALADAKSASDTSVEISIQTLGRAIQVALDSLPRPHAKTAELYHTLGKQYYKRKAYEMAMQQFQQAVNIRRELLPTQPSIAKDLAKSYHNLSFMQRELGMLLPAIENVHHCIETHEAIQPIDSNLLFDEYIQAGTLYDKTGDLKNALRYTEQAHRYFLRINTQPATLARTCSELGVIYNSLEDYTLASHFNQQAIAQYDKLGMTLEKTNILNNLGTTFLQQNDHENALKTYLQAAALNHRLLHDKPGDPDLTLARSTIFNNLSIIYKRSGHFQQAIAASRESLRLGESASTGPFRPEVALCLDNLGDALFLAGDIKPALEAYQKGISAIVPEFQDADVLKNPAILGAVISEKPLLLVLLRDKANALHRSSRSSSNPVAMLRGAFNTWQSADTLLLQIRQSCHEDGSKFFLAETTTTMYEQALSLTFDLWTQTRDTLFLQAMLAFCERNKAGVLLESLNDLRAKRQAGVKDTLLERDQGLRKAIARQETSVNEALQKGNNSALQSGKDSLFLLKQQLEQLGRQLEADNPGLFLQKFALTATTPPHALQQRLPPNTALMEYFLGDSTLFTICLSQKSFRVWRSTLPGNFKTLGNQFHRAVSDWSFVQEKPADAEAAYLESAPALFDVLLRKQLEALEQENIERLIIVPDGTLSFLPFEALLTEKASGWKQKQLPSLLQRYAVSYAYAAGFIDRRNAATYKTAFRGMGLTYDDRTLQSLHPAQDDVSDTLTPRNTPGKLPYSSREVGEIARLMDGQCWLDAEATKANFLQRAPESGILHFAGHGFTDASQPLNSFLLFSKTDDTTDCRLRAADLYGLQLHANLAVLSACNTGFGELRRGEGVMSFARAFAGAGVPSVVMSLWSITDASTAHIMKQFYVGLKDGKPKDQALQQAKLEYLAAAPPDRALPIFWAGAVLMGDAAALPDATDTGQLFWLLAAFLVGMGLVLRWRKKRHAF